MKIKTSLTDFEVEGLENSSWEFHGNLIPVEANVWQFDFSLVSGEAARYPKLTISWEFPLLDTVNCWSSQHSGSSDLPPDWGWKRSFSIANHIPELVFHNREGMCTASAAFSDALRTVEFSAGVHESTCALRFTLALFRREEASGKEYAASVRFNMNRIFYAEIVRKFTAWYETFPQYRPLPVPETAYDPLYSTWYCCHHDVHGDEIERECHFAAACGMKTIIVDSGWENDDNTLGPGACGTWRPSVRRFPDFAAHVKRVQALGFRYLVWFAVPYIGKRSENFKRFQGRYLRETFDAGILDPRFANVREFLISACRALMSDYSLDGLKLDFIDLFTSGSDDPALSEGMGERDMISIPDAVDRLMTEICHAIRNVRPDALIEFRQPYSGPAIRKYGNMLRATDCPADPGANRRNTIKLRLASGKTAVHSDMLEWRRDYDVIPAALQLLSVLFSVPQISVNFAELPDDHRRMLRFLLSFFIAHRDLLLKTDLNPRYPDYNYPVVYAVGKTERIAAVYCGGVCAEFGSEAYEGVTYLVNATAREGILLDFVRPKGGARAILRNCLGERIPVELPPDGLSRVPMPPASILEISPAERPESRE